MAEQRQALDAPPVREPTNPFRKAQPVQRINGYLVVRVGVCDLDEIRGAETTTFRRDIPLSGWRPPFWQRLKDAAEKLFG